MADLGVDHMEVIPNPHHVMCVHEKIVHVDLHHRPFQLMDFYCCNIMILA